MSALSYKKMIEKKPWYVSWKCARRRCIDPNHTKYNFYGGKGIRFYLTKGSCALLWKRDQAHLMDKPQLDRIESDDHYWFGNCRFIEGVDNRARVNRSAPPDDRVIEEFEPVPAGAWID